MEQKTKRIPVQHIIGFVISLVLTVIAAWAALESSLPKGWVITGIMVLAVMQAALQLFMFMHMTEFASGNGHVPWNMIFHGFVIAAIIVAGSLFTMSYGFGHHHGDDMEQHEQMEDMHH